MFKYPTVHPKVSIRDNEFVISVPLEEVIIVAENCSVQPAKVTDAAAFGAYVAEWLQQHIREVEDAITFATREVLEDASFMGAGIQLVMPPYEDYIDSMWASTCGGMVEPRPEGFWRADPWHCGPRSPRDCVVAAICADRAGEHKGALEWLHAGWPGEDLIPDHWEVTNVPEEALEYANKTYGREVA